MRRRALIIAILTLLVAAFALRRATGAARGPLLSVAYAGPVNPLAPGPSKYCGGFLMTNTDSRQIGFTIDAVEWDTDQGPRSFDLSAIGWSSRARRWAPGYGKLVYQFLPPQVATNGLEWRVRITCWFEGQGTIDSFNQLCCRLLNKDLNAYRGIHSPSVLNVTSNLPPVQPNKPPGANSRHEGSGRFWSLQLAAVAQAER